MNLFLFFFSVGSNSSGAFWSSNNINNAVNGHSSSPDDLQHSEARKNQVSI